MKPKKKKIERKPLAKRKIQKLRVTIQREIMDEFELDENGLEEANQFIGDNTAGMGDEDVKVEVVNA